MENLYTQVWELTVLGHGLLIVKFRLKWKKVGKPTRPFRYDLHQVPYKHTVVNVTKIRGLNLTDRAPKELWKVVCNIVQEAVIKTIPKETKMQKDKMVVRGGLTNS